MATREQLRDMVTARPFRPYVITLANGESFTIRHPELVSCDARGRDIAFEVLRHTPAEYVSAAGRAGWQRSEVFGRLFRLQRQRGRLGLWRYTLQGRAAR